MGTAKMNNDNSVDNAHSRNHLNGHTTGEMDILGEQTILCQSTSISNNSPTHTSTLIVAATHTQNAHNRSRHEHETTTTAPALFSTLPWNYPLTADKPLDTDAETVRNVLKR